MLLQPATQPRGVGDAAGKGRAGRVLGGEQVGRLAGRIRRELQWVALVQQVGGDRGHEERLRWRAASDQSILRNLLDSIGDPRRVARVPCRIDRRVAHPAHRRIEQEVGLARAQRLMPKRIRRVAIELLLLAGQLPAAHLDAILEKGHAPTAALAAGRAHRRPRVGRDVGEAWHLRRKWKS